MTVTLYILHQTLKTVKYVALTTTCLQVQTLFLQIDSKCREPCAKLVHNMTMTNFCSKTDYARPSPVAGMLTWAVDSTAQLISLSFCITVFYFKPLTPSELPALEPPSSFSHLCTYAH